MLPYVFFAFVQIFALVDAEAFLSQTGDRYRVKFRVQIREHLRRPFSDPRAAEL